jgi:hypothetical protein
VVELEEETLVVVVVLAVFAQMLLVKLLVEVLLLKLRLLAKQEQITQSPSVVVVQGLAQLHLLLMAQTLLLAQ